MPSSQANQIPAIVNVIKEANPKSMLDIGPGFGKYGMLAREYLELYDGREKYNDFQVRVDAVEAFAGLCNPAA